MIPGTLTVVAGATGIGKSQLGIQWAHAGLASEGERGILFDLTTRGDSQNHSDYARRVCDWSLTEMAPEEGIIQPEEIWDRAKARKDYVHVFQKSGRRVTRSDLNEDDWREWKVELSRKLDRAIAFFYGNFVHGSRRVVIDGVEPTERQSESFQFHLIDYVYHQILRKEDDWVARDLFRVHFRSQEQTIQAHRYNHRQIGCLLLYTTHEVMLEDLLNRRLDDGDALANANTIILMGKTREGNKLGRALYVAKHRGSALIDEIIPFEITSTGLTLP